MRQVPIALQVVVPQALGPWRQWALQERQRAWATVASQFRSTWMRVQHQRARQYSWLRGTEDVACARSMALLGRMTS